jgi:acyl-CoA reductase-like NAD-dependent aldehyde dehydrogenase
MSWTDDAEVMAIANGLEYGLTAGILTNDIHRALKMARQVQAGYVWVNNASDHYPGVPFGGYKDSGLGREECLEELLSYTQVKAINITIR